jgi:peptide/histidine transporter 3/4
LLLLGFTTEVGIYVGLLAIALGKSSQAPNLKAFLADQLFISGREDPHKDEEKIEGRRKVWWRIGWFSGMIIAIFVLQNASWKTSFTASIMVMGTNFLLFWFGFSFYCPERPVKSPLIICFRVFKAAISKRHLTYPHTPDQLYKNDTGNIHLLPEVRYLR